MGSELEAQVTMESRAAWAQNNDTFKQELAPQVSGDSTDSQQEQPENDTPMVDFE